MPNEFARQLRKDMTPQERKLWNLIRNKQFYGYRFNRQYPFRNYILDFICCSKKIVLEIDGGQHNEKEISKYDITRFWNNEIDNNIEGVYNKLKEIFEIED